jgi:hypothetical protein
MRSNGKTEQEKACNCEKCQAGKAKLEEPLEFVELTGPDGSGVHLYTQNGPEPDSGTVFPCSFLKTGANGDTLAVVLELPKGVYRVEDLQIFEMVVQNLFGVSSSKLSLIASDGRPVVGVKSDKKQASGKGQKWPVH